MSTEPTIDSFHIGAGRQSTTIALLIAQGILPKPDVALFSDTGNEPKVVYRHLQRIERELLAPAGVPLRLVSHGDLFDDVLSPHAFATIPAYTLELVPKERGFLKWNDREAGRQERHCTGRYKVEPLQREERILLGATTREVACTYCASTGTRFAPWNAKALIDWLGEDKARSVIDLLGFSDDELADLATNPERSVVQAYKDKRWPPRPLPIQREAILDACGVADPAEWMQPGPCNVCRGTAVRTLVDEAPAGQVARVWIGYDASEAAMRINDRKFTAYQQPAYPLLDLPRPPERIAEDRKRLKRHTEIGWTLADCLWFLHRNGYKDTPKSACIPCPNRSNAGWRHMRDNDPESWQTAIEQDRALRTAPGMRAQRFLHEDRKPLDQVDVDRRSAAERKAAQGDIFDALADIDFGGCSPHGCSTDLLTTNPAA